MTEMETKALVDKGPMPKIVATNESGAVTLSDLEGQPTKSERGKAMRQIIAAFIANMGAINIGLIFGFSAVALPQLTAPDSPIPVDESQSSWIASFASIGTPIGCLLSGYVMDKFGRKTALLLTEIPSIVGWATIAWATNVEMIYAGRVLTGLGSGMVAASARVYTSEVTQPHMRGMLGALSSTGVSFGVLFQYAIGAMTTWSTLSAICASIPVLAFVLMMFMPETPNYLVSKNKPEQALKSLAQLRGSTYNVEREVNQLKAFAQRSNQKKKMTPKETIEALLHPSCLKPFAILFLYFLIYQFSGTNTITFYAVDVFQESGTTMDKYTCTILFGAVRLVFTVLAAILLRRCGRRPLTFISSIGCGLTMIGLGTYLYYKKTWDMAVPPIAPTATWFPVACIFIFNITCTLGFLVVPWVMIGELYPMKVRGIVGDLTTCVAHGLVFIVLKTYPFFSHLLGRYGAYMMYGSISTVGTIFFYFCLPETKGKTLQEIEDYFSGRIKSLKKSKQLEAEGQQLNNNSKPQLLTVGKNNLLP